MFGIQTGRLTVDSTHSFTNPFATDGTFEYRFEKFSFGREGVPWYLWETRPWGVSRIGNNNCMANAKVYEKKNGCERVKAGGFHALWDWYGWIKTGLRQKKKNIWLGLKTGVGVSTTSYLLKRCRLSFPSYYYLLWKSTTSLCSGLDWTNRATQ